MHDPKLALGALRRGLFLRLTCGYFLGRRGTYVYLKRILGGRKNRLKSMAIEIFKTAALSRSAIPPALSPCKRWAFIW